MSADLPSTKRLPVRFIVIGLIILIHGIVFYAVIHQRAKPPGGDSRQAFTPVERESGGSSGSLTTQPRPAAVAAALRPDSRWRFDPIEVLPGDDAPEDTSAATGRLQEPEATDVAAKSRISINSWTRPDYPLAWAQAGDEGSVSFDVHLDASGKPTEVKLLRAAAPPRLVQSAQRAASAWRFSMPAATTAWAEIELRFTPYRYGYSFVGEPLPDGKPDPGKKPVDSQASFRELVGELSSSKPTFATQVNSQPAYQKMRSTVVKWGRPVQLRLLNPKESMWQEYPTKPEFRGATYGGTVTLRWDLYEVRHEHAKARWKIATDPFGRIWAAKADTY